MSRVKKKGFIAIFLILCGVALLFTGAKGALLRDYAYLLMGGRPSRLAKSYTPAQRDTLGYRMADSIRRRRTEIFAELAFPYPPKHLTGDFFSAGPEPYSLLIPQRKGAAKDLPNPRKVSEVLFKRRTFIPEPRLSALTPFLANFVIESLFETTGKPSMIRFPRGFVPYKKPNGYNAASRYLDLYPVYHRSEMLRSYVDGKMWMHKVKVNGKWELFPPLLSEVKKKYPHFTMDNPLKKPEDKLFATGTKRGNLHTVMMGYITLFLRTHNALCDQLKQRYPKMNDEQLFRKSRNIVLALFVKFVWEVYISKLITPGINPAKFSPDLFKFPLGYITPYELNIAYAWHSFIPDGIVLKKKKLSLRKMGYNSKPLLAHGLRAIFASLSQQKAGKIGLYNTSKHLRDDPLGPVGRLDVEAITIQKTRDLRLGSYNDYRRELFRKEGYTKWSQFSPDKRVQKDLASLYKSPDDVDLYVGIMSSTHEKGTALPVGVYRFFLFTILQCVWSNPFFRNYLTKKNLTPYGYRLFQKQQGLDFLKIGLSKDLRGIHFTFPKKSKTAVLQK